MKVCSKCKIEKELSMFGKDKRSKDGMFCYCKECKKEISKIYRDNNKTKIQKRMQKYREDNRVVLNKKYKKYYSEHIEERKIYNKKDWLKNKEYYQNYKKENIERIREYKSSYCRNRRKNDIEFKILCNLRGRLSHIIKNKTNSNSTKKLLGCSVDFLKNHLQSQFKDNMNWNNYGKGGWEIDHIRPCAKFDLTKESEQHKCFNYTNLQPLWAEENKIKGATYNG